VDKKNRRIIEELLARYRLFKTLDDDDPEVAISSLERKKFVQKVERAVNRLPAKEKQLVTARYLDPDADYLKDYQIYGEVMQISENTYSKIRNSAISKLAVMLGITIQGGREHAE
jgi:ArpU family phage transcriptional regulator